MLLIVSFAPAAAQDWPQLLGPARNGVYTGPGRNPAGLEWKKPVGAGFAAPVVAEGKLIVFHRQKDKELVEARNPATGAVLWTYAYTTGYRDDFGFDEGPRSAPTADGGRVYTFGAEGQLHCINLADGKRIWSEDTHARFKVRKGYFGAAGAPLVDEARVLMNIGGPQAGIVAFDRNNGKVLWTATDDPAGYSSPILATLGGLKRALFLTRTGLVDIEPASGKVRYKMRWRSRSDASVNAATPVVAGDVLFLSSSYGTGAVAFEVNGSEYRQLWASDDALSNHYATSVHKDGYLYGFHGRQEQGQQLRCVELRTGKVKWSVDGLRAGTVTLAGGHLLVLRENGELVVGSADPIRFQVESRHQLLDGVVRAYPAWSGGRLYLRNEDTLACYRLK
jgi:outer membrane protein assembly factor BamB